MAKHGEELGSEGTMEQCIATEKLGGTAHTNFDVLLLTVVPSEPNLQPPKCPVK